MAHHAILFSELELAAHVREPRLRAAPPILIVFVDQSCVGSGVIVKHVIIERALQGSRPGSKPGARGGGEPQFSSSRASN